MTAVTDADWSWFADGLVQIRRRGEDVWAETMPMTCPRCLLDWSPNGIEPIGDAAYRGWGCPPDEAGERLATRYWECLRCGHTTYARR